jgi:hypothetical protein
MAPFRFSGESERGRDGAVPAALAGSRPGTS